MRCLRTDAIVFASLLAACGIPADSPIAAERSDSASIEIVTNRGPDRTLAWTFTPTLTLGGEDEGPASFYRISDGYVSFDAAGNIYVLDFGAQHVVIFDSTGAYFRTLGAAGQGPGELQFPERISVSPEGIVSVLDFAKQGVLQWGPDGSVRSMVHLHDDERPSRIAFVSGDAVYSSMSTDSTTQRTTLVREVGDSVVQLAALALPRPKMTRYESCRVGLAAQPYFSPSLDWSSSGDRIAASSSQEYEIAVWDAGRRMLIRRDVPPQPTSAEMVAREIGDSMKISFGGGLSCSIPAAELAEARGFAPVVPAIGALIIAPDGSIWIRRGGPRNDPPIIDVFDATGEYLGTLPMGSPVPIAFTPGGDVAAVSKDTLNDVNRLVIYRVNREDGGTR